MHPKAKKRRTTKAKHKERLNAREGRQRAGHLVADGQADGHGPGAAPREAHGAVVADVEHGAARGAARLGGPVDLLAAHGREVAREPGELPVAAGFCVCVCVFFVVVFCRGAPGGGQAGNT